MVIKLPFGEMDSCRISSHTETFSNCSFKLDKSREENEMGERKNLVRSKIIIFVISTIFFSMVWLSHRFVSFVPLVCNERQIRPSDLISHRYKDLRIFSGDCPSRSWSTRFRRRSSIRYWSKQFRSR